MSYMVKYSNPHILIHNMIFLSHLLRKITGGSEINIAREWSNLTKVKHEDLSVDASDMEM